MIDIEKLPKLYPPNIIESVMLIITDNCNLACKYCYEKDKHAQNNMSQETVISTIDFLYSQGGKNPSITFFGGEPLLNIDAIKAAYLYIKETKRNVELSIITNGTIMTDEYYDLVQKMIIDNNYSTQLSIDGSQEVQDISRIKKDGKSCFKSIEKNISKYKELYKDAPELLNIHGVLDKDTIGSLFKSFLFFKETWKIDRIWFMPANNIEWDSEDVKKYDEQMGLITEYLINHKDFNTFSPLDKIFNQLSNKPCGAGQGYVSVNYDGFIFPCHQLYFANKNNPLDIMCGNVLVGIDADRLRMFQCYDNGDLTACQGCEHVHCYRCIASNYEKYGSCFSQIKDNYCEMMKIDRKYQLQLKEASMGLINNQEPQKGGHWFSDEQYKGMIDILSAIELKTSGSQLDEQVVAYKLNNILKNLGMSK
jgi:sulfatase maturation enzyme AslB (radical SAM superfamily)